MSAVNVLITIVLLILIVSIGYFQHIYLFPGDGGVCMADELTIKQDNYNFYDCSKGTNIHCKNGIFLRGNKHECIESECKYSVVIYETFGDYTIPIKMTSCVPGTNIRIEKSCDINIEVIAADDVSILSNTNYTAVEVQRRFEATVLPLNQLSIETGECIDFVPMSLVRMVTHNPILPKVPLNIRTKAIEYSVSDVGMDVFYYKDYLNVKRFPENAIVSGLYANFTTTADVNEIKYKDTVKIAMGDRDGVTYLISFEMPPFRGRSVNSFCYTEDTPPCGGHWSTYLQEYVEHGWFAQSYQAKNALGLIDYDETSFTFRYVITLHGENYELHVITLFGFSTFEIELNDGVQIDSNGLIIIENYPSYSLIIEKLSGPNTTVVVTNIYDKKYNRRHVPIFWPYIKIKSLLWPELNLSELDLTIDDLFDVPHEYIYVSPAPSSASSLSA